MALGYYIDPITGRYEWGENPNAKPTIQEVGQTTPVQYSSVKDAGEVMSGVGAENLSDATRYGDNVGAKPTSSNGGMAGTAAAVQTANQGGNALDIAGAGLTSAGMMKANPYLLGAGLGLSTISAVNKNKQEQAMNRYKAEVQKVNARQQAINNLASIGRGLKA